MSRDDFYFDSLKEIAAKCGVSVATVNSVQYDRPVANNVQVDEIKKELIHMGLKLELVA